MANELLSAGDLICAPIINSNDSSIPVDSIVCEIVLLVCHGRIPKVNTDHTSGQSPFDLGTSNIPINTQSLSESVGAAATSSLDDTSRTDLGGPDTGSLEFRVIRPGIPVRRLRLTGKRYTFGSAEGCSIRLNDPTLRPMHAVLIRDAHRVLVRAYSVPLEINGNRITEAHLQLGDIIRMGAYRFELLSGLDPAISGHPSVTQQPVARTGPPTGYPALPAHDLDDAAWQAHLRHESAQWRLRQSEVDVRENRCIERETDLRSREAELWARADQVHLRESKLAAQEAAALQIQEEFAARKHELKRLREESQVQQELLDERQTQIQSMEAEYREQVEQATRQLEQSQQQAESATEAVQRMREQFAELNEQLAILTDQQKSLENHDDLHLQQQQQLRVELEAARDDAIDARAESDARRQAAEARVAELTAQLASQEERFATQDELLASQTQQLANQTEQLSNQSEQLLSKDAVADEVERLNQQLHESESRCEATQQRVDELTEQLAAFDSEHTESTDRIAEYETMNAQLREQIEELQSRVAEATDEASQLRIDYEGSCASIRQLELLVDQATTERDDARSGLTTESESLRETVDQLTSELDKANEELNELRSANEALSAQLNSTCTERDEAVADAESRPTTQAWDELRVELEDANQRLEKMPREYSETLSRIDGSEFIPDGSEVNSDSPANENNDETSGFAADIASKGAAAAGLAAGAVSMVGSVFATPDQPEMESPESVSGVQAAAPATETPKEPSYSDDTASDVDADDSGGWPTYESTTSVGGTTSDDTATAAETAQDEVAGGWNAPSDLAPASIGATDASETTEEEPNPWATEASSSQDDSPSENIWRTEAEQSVQESGHLSGWDTPGEEWSAESAETSDTPQWSEESPEVAVNETIAEIESNVDQAIAEIDSLTSDAADSQMEPSSNDDSMVDEVDETAEQPGSTFALDPDQLPDAVDPSGYEPVNPSPDANTDDEPSASDDTEYSSAINKYLPTEQETPESSGIVDDDSESGSFGSLADQLINDISNDSDVVESSSYESESYDEPEAEEEVDSTFVMPTTEEAEEESSGWNLQSPDHVASDDETSDANDVADTSMDETPSYAEQETTQPETSEPENTAGGAQDDSIEAYMNRLLQRVQGDEDEVPSTQAPDTESVGENTTAIVERDESPEPEAVEKPPEEDYDPAAPLVPRSHAPERNSDMSAMRELANQSARSAVARSVKIKARDTQMEAGYKFGAAVICLVCAVACLWGLAHVGAIIRWGGVFLALCASGFYIKEGLDKWKEAASRVRLAESAQAGDEEAAKVLDEEQKAAASRQ